MRLTEVVRQIRARWNNEAASQALAPPARRANRRERRSLLLEPLEPRVLLAANPFYTAAGAAAGVSLSLQVQDRNGVQMLELTDATSNALLQSSAVSSLTGPIDIVGSNFDDSLTINVNGHVLPQSVLFEGGSGIVTLGNELLNSSLTVTAADGIKTAPGATIVSAGDVTLQVTNTTNLNWAAGLAGFKEKGSAASIDITGASISAANINLSTLASTTKLANVNKDLAQDTRAVATGDFNGDGKLDLVQANFDGTTLLFLNNGTATPFDGTPSQIIGRNPVGGALTPNATSLAVGDVNKDGKLDLLLGVSGGPSLLFLNGGSATTPFDGVTAINVGTGTDNTAAVALADVNGDGRIDAVLGNSGSVSRYFLNDGTATPFKGAGTALNANPDKVTSIAIGDINGDTLPDVVLGTNGSGTLAIFNTASSTPFIAASPVAKIGALSDNTTAVALADVNGDGRLDLIVANVGQATHLYSNVGGANPFAAAAQSIGSTADAVTAIAVANVAGSARADLILGSATNPSQLYINNDSATPFSGVPIAIGAIDTLQPVGSMAVGDINGDGKLDLVLGNDNDLSKAYLNTGTATPFVDASVSLVNPDSSLIQRVNESALFDFNAFGAVILATAKSTITLGTGTTLNSTGNVTVDAEALANASNTTIGLLLGVTYADVESTASVTMQSGAKIIANGSVGLQGNTTNVLSASTTVIAPTLISLSVSYGKLRTHASADVQEGASVSGNNVSISAHNTNQVNTSASSFNLASAQAGGAVAAGVGVAIGDYASDATAAIHGSASSAGSLTVDARSIDTQDITSASASVINPPAEVKGLPNFLSSRIATAFNPKLDGIRGVLGQALSAGGTAKLGVGAGVAVVNSTHAATALIGSHAVVKSLVDATVNARAEDNFRAYATGSASDSETAAIGGGVAVSTVTNTANATVADGAQVDVEGVFHVVADAVLPNPVQSTLPALQFTPPTDNTNTPNSAPADRISNGFTYGQQASDGVGNILTNGVKPFVLGILTGDPKAVGTTYVQGAASPKAGAKAGISGAVNVINVANTAIASIGKDARINQNTNHGAGQDVWVEALTTLITIDLAGMASVLSLYDLTIAKPTASAGVGGNFDYIGYNNTASAYIDDRAVVSAGRDVKVTANSLNYLMTVVAQGTKGTSVGVTGAIAFADVSNNTLAHIEDGARINATHDVVVAAGSTLSMFNADGALGIGAAAGVGLGLSVNLARADNTFAFIGDNNGVTTTVGSVQAGHDLNVQARSQEQLWSIAAAGAVATGQSQDPPSSEDWSKLLSAPWANVQEITASLKDKKFGFGVSGAVALNKLSGSTEAFIRMPGTVTVANALTVNADDQSLFVQGSGAFGIGKEAGIGGSASATDIDKRTWAFIDNAIVKAGTLSVTANAGEQSVSVAAGAAGGKDSAAVAGSVSLNLVHSDTDAWLGASAGAGPSVRFAINGDALVQAQHTMDAISVAGAVSVGVQTNAAVGAALDFDVVDTHVNAYVDSNAALTTQAGNVRIFAANSEVSRGVAAALAVSAQDGVGASGTVSGSSLTDEVHAYTLSNIGAFGNVRIDADDNTDRVIVAGGAAGGKDAGVGLTAAAASIGRDVKAWVGDGVLLGTSGGSPPVGDPQGSGFGGAGLTLDATSEDGLLIFAAGGAGGSNAGVAVTATIDLVTGDTEAWIGSSAKITGSKVGLFDPASVQIRAHDDRTVVAVAGAVAGGQKAGVGAALVAETINTVTQAHINSSATVNAAGNVVLDASVAETNTAVAAGFAGGGNGGGAGSAVGIGRTTNTQAFAGDSTKITATGNVALGADDDFSVVPIAGAGGFGGNGGVAASNVTLVDTATTKAFLGVLAQVTVQANGPAVSVASGQRDANGRKIASLLNGLSITATEHQKLRPVTVGGAGGGTAGVAGSATVLVLNDTTQASIGSGAIVNSSQQVNLLAADDTDSISAAGGLAGGGTAGIGAGADVGTITKNTQAFLAAPNAVANAPKVTASGDVLLRALSTESMLSVSGAAGIGGSVGLAGAAGVYVLNDTTYAFVGFGASVTANGNVLVSADDESQLLMVAGSLSGSGTVGVGAAAGVSTLSKDTQAFVSNGATVSANAKTPAITIENGQFNTVGGYFTPSARVNATTDAITFATPSGFADGQAVTYRNGGGGSIGNLVDGNTYYVIRVDANTFKLAGSLADWQAGKAIDLTLTGTTGSQHSLLPSGSIALPTVTNTDLVQGDTGRLPTLLGRRSLSPQTESFSGVAVTAISKEAIETYAVSAGGAGAVAVSVAGAVAVTSANTLATIGAGASVTSGNNLKVVAGENLFHIGVGGTAAVGGTVAVTPGVDVTVAKNTTKATVSDGATLKAQQDVAVAARGEENLLSISIGLSGSGTAALSGAVSVLTIDNHVIASLGNTTNVDTGGNVSVTANDNTANGIIAGAAAIGGAGGGFGASVAVTQINKDTQAFIGTNSVISARGQSAATLTAFDPNSAVVTSNLATNKSFTGLQVAADSNENLFAVGVAGAGGAIGGIAGAVSAELISASTLASVGSNTQINPGTAGAAATQSIFITATNTVTVFGADGAVAGGAIGGLAGGVDVDIIRNNTATTIGTGVLLAAKQDVEVDAVATRAISSYAASGAAGAVGIAGGVSVISVGAALDSNAQSSLKPNDSGNTATTGGFLDGQAKSTPISNLLGGFTAPSGSSDNTQRLATTVGKAVSTITAAGPASSPSAILGGTAAAGTNAQIGNQVNVTSGRDVTVFARELDGIAAQSVGAVGVGIVGIGGAVGVVSVASPVSASIGNAGTGTATRIRAGGNVNVTGARDSVYSGGAIGTTNGLAGLGAQVLIFNDTSDLSAAIAGGASVVQAQSVNILAQGGYRLGGSASGGSLSAVAATGSVVHETATGKINASLGDGVQVGQEAGGTVGNLNIQSIDSAQATATTRSVAITVAGGSGADSQVTLAPTLSATIGAGSAVAVTGNVYSQAYASQVVSAIAKGINAGALTIGVDNAATTVTAALADSVGNGARIVAGGNVTLQSQSQVKASSEGHASGGAAISGTGVQSTTTLSQTAQTTLGTSVNLAAVGAVDINAHADSVDSTTSDDGGFSVVGVGNSASVLLKTEAASVSLGTSSNVVAGGTLSLSAGSINNFNDSPTQSTQGPSRVSATTGGLSTSASAVISRKANVTVGQQDYLRSKGDLSLAAEATPQVALTSQSPISGFLGKPTSASGTTTTSASATVLVLDNANLQTAGTLSLNALGRENHNSSVSGGTVTVGGPVGLTQQDAAAVTAQVKTNPGVQMSAALFGATVVAGYASNRTPEQLTKTQDLTLNGDIYSAGAQDRQLVVNGDGSLSLRSNLDAQVTADSVIVADFVPTVPQPLRVVLNNAGGTNGGSAVIHNNSVLSNVSITNNSSKNLVINTLSALVSQSTPTVTLNGAATTVYAVASIPVTGKLTITNNGAGSMTLQKNVTTQGDLTLTTVDNAAAGQDITLKAGALVTANHIIVQAGDNVTMEAGSALTSTTSTLDVAGDFGNADVGVGTVMNLSDGALLAAGAINISGGTDADSITTGVRLRSTGGAVNVSGGDGNDALDVRGYAGTTTLSVLGGNGDDVITLGDIVDPVAGTRRLGSITGTVQVNPGPGNDSLNLLDTGDALATNGTLSATGLTGAGLGSGGVVTFNDVIETVTLSLGSGANTLQVLGTRAGTSTLINGGAGRDTVTVGSAALGGNGTTGGIQGALAIFDSLGSAQLIVEDGGATAAQTTTIDATTISGAGLGAVVTYTASATSRVDLLVNLGSGADAVTVLNTSGVLQVNGNGGDDNFALRAAGSGADPSFFGGAGNDTLTLSSAASGGTVTNLFATVAFDGGVGNDALVIDDSGATVLRNAHITNSRVDIAALTANYAGIESLKLAMGAGNDSVSVASTAAATATSVLTGAGDDFVYAGSAGNALGNNGTLAGMAGALNIDGQTGTDTLFIDDTQDTAARTGTLTATGLQGLGMTGPGINFAGIETLTCNLGSGANNLTLAGAGNIGNVAVDRPTTDTSSGSIFVMDDPFAATATGTLSSWQFFRNNALAAGPQQITPLLLKPGANGTWTVVAVGTTRTATTAGLQTYDFGLVSGTAQVAGLYFGWKDGGAGTGGNVGVPEWTDNTPGTNVIWLGSGQGALAVNNNYGVVGTFARTYSVQAFATTTAAAPALQTTTINSGAGNDTFNVQATFSATTIHGGAGNDVFAVGSRTPGSRGNLNAIANTLTVDGGAGTDSVTLDDSSDVLDNNGSLTSTKLSGMGMGDGVVYGAVESLTLTMGAGNDTFNVTSTNAGTTTTLNGGPGDDIFTGALGGVIANPLVAASTAAPIAKLAVASAQAVTPSTAAPSPALNSLVINGDAGTDTLLLDDSASQNATDFNVTATQITGTGIGAGGVNYQAVENLNLQPGSGGGNFNIISSVAGSTITLKGTPGDDRKTLTPTAANIVYDAGQGNNVVTIAAPAPSSGPVGKITVLAGDGNNIIIGGSGDDTIIVGNGSNLIVGGGGNDTIKAGNGQNLIFGDVGSIKLDGHGRLIVAAGACGNAGKDSIVVGNGNNVIFGGGGSDQITTGNGNNIVFGDFGRLVFDSGVLKEAAGQDDEGKEFGQKGGADTITTGAGNDLIFGGAGVDTIVPGGGKNKVFQDGDEVEGNELINWSGQYKDAAWMQSVSGTKLSPMLTNLKALASQLDPNRDLRVVL